MRSKTITLRLDGDDIPVGLFLTKATSFVNLLRDLSRSVLTDLGVDIAGEPAIQWVIESIHAGSPVVMDLRPDVLVPDMDAADVGNLVIDSTTRGLRAITAPEELEEPPEYFTEAVLDDVHSLARVMYGELRAVSVSSTPEDAVTLTQWASTNTERFVRVTREFRGSVRGTLQMVSVAGNPHIHVREYMTGRSIRCNVPDELMDEVVGAFRRRVEVYGRKQTNQRGDVLRISLEGLQVLPEQDQLPSVEEILTPVDLTEGQSIREFMLGLRDAG